MKPDAELLREIGVTSTNASNAWAGAADPLSRGLHQWTRQVIGTDRQVAVRAGIAACDLVVDRYVQDQPELPPRSYLDLMLASIRRWLDDPSRDNLERVRSSLDVTRSAHAWQRERDVASFWILDAVDHASIAVWSGERASYIVPVDFATTSARAIVCVLHALLDLKIAEPQAVELVVDAIQPATA